MSDDDWMNGLASLAAQQAGLLSRRQLLDAGFNDNRLNTLRRNGKIIRITRGVYEVLPIPAVMELTGRTDRFHWVRVRGAWIGLLSAENSVATGAAALALHGVWGLPMRITPEIALRSRAASQGAPGVRIRQFAKTFPVVQKHGRYIAALEVALAQAMPGFGLRRAVAVVDSCMNRGLMDASGIVEVRQRLRGQRGVRALGAWWEHIDGRAQSPMESFARLDCVEAGLKAPELQVEIWEEEQFIARADLGWRKNGGAWVLVEIDGREFHENPEALFRDRERQNRIMLHARHTILRFTGRDVMRGRVAPTVVRALQG